MALSFNKYAIPPDVWWRAETRAIAHWDYEYETVTDYSYQVDWYGYDVIRTTPKGVVIDIGFGDEKFILGTALKQFAVPTKDLAIQDEIARRNRHVQGCKARLAKAEKLLETARKEQDKS